jgi:hypothetical protein
MGLGELRLRSRHGTDKQAGEKKSLRAAGGGCLGRGSVAEQGGSKQSLLSLIIFDIKI